MADKGGRKAKLQTEVDSSGAKKGFQEVKDAAKDMAQGVTASGQQAGKAVDAIGAGAGPAAQKVEAATRSLIGSIQRTTAMMEAGSKASTKYYEALAAQRGVNINALRPYLDQLDALQKKQQAVGVSVGQTTQAFRQLPAQMTDIVTQLAGGQSPFLVLLQQGGQIKDSFGGVGAAIRALASTITPVTVAIGGTALALGGLGLAVANFESQQRTLATFNAQLAATGRAGILTGTQLQGLVRDLAALPGVSKDAAEKTVSEFTKIHSVGSGMFRDLALLSADYARATGTDVPTAAKKLADAFADPVKGAKDLDSALGTLSASTRVRIEDLIKQNDLTGAQNVLVAALKTNLSGLARDGVTPLQEATNKLGNAWNDAMKAFGESQSLRVIDGLLTSLVSHSAEFLKYLEKIGAVPALGAVIGGSMIPGALPGAVGVAAGSAIRSAVTPNTGGATGTWTPDPAAVNATTRAINEQSSALRDQIKRTLDATAGFKSYAEQQADMAQQLKNVNRDIAALSSSVPKGQSLSADDTATLRELQKRRAGLQEAIARAAPPNTGQEEVAAIKATTEARRLDLQALREYGAEAVKLTEGDKLVIKIKEQLKTALSGAAREQKNRALAAAEEQASVDKQIQSEQRYIKSVEDARKATGEVTNDAENIRARAAAQEAANASLGKSQVAMEGAALAQMKLSAAQLEATDRTDPVYLAALYLKIQAQERYVQALKDGQYAELVKSQAEQARSNRETTDTIQFELSLLGQTAEVRAVILAKRQAEVALAKELAAIDKLDISDPQKDERKAAARANAQVNAANLAQQRLIDINQRTADQLNQSLTDALLRGFESGKSFAENFRDTVKNMFATMILRPVIQATLAPVSGAISGSINSALGLGNSSSNILSIGQKAFDFFGGGTAAASTGVEALGFGASELASAGVTASSVGVGGGLSAAFSAIPGWGWAALGAAAVASFLGGDHGGPKVSGRAGIYPGFDPNSSALDSSLAQTVKGLEAQFGTFTKALGVAAPKLGLYASTDPQGSSQTLLGFNAAVNGKEVFSSFKTDIGRAAEEINAAIQGEATRAFVEALRAQSDKLDPSTAEFVKSLNTSTDSIEKLTAGLDSLSKAATVTSTLDQLGISIESLAKVSVEGKAALINAFGGTDAFASAFASFQKNFYSAQEQLGAQRNALKKQFDSLGLVLPGTKQEFRDLVTGLDVTTESGRNTLAALLSVSDAFSQMSDAAQSAANDAISAAKASATANTDAIKNGTNAAFEILKNSIAAQQQALDDAFNTASTTWQSTIDSLTSNVSGLQGLSDSLRSALNNMSLGGSVSEAITRKIAQRQISDALALAQSGNASQINQSQLSAAISVATKPSQTQFADFISYAKDYAKTASDISMLAGVTDDQLGLQKRQLEAANDTLAALKKQHDQDTSNLVALQKSAQDQIDAINGTTLAVKSVSDALAAFQTAVKVSTGGTTPGTPSTGTSGTGTTGTSTQSSQGFNPALVQAAWQNNPDSFRQVYQSELANGGSLARLDEIFKQSAGVAEAMAARLGLPGFANGLARVPYDNFLARLHQDEMVMPARQAKEFRSVDFSKIARDDSALVEEMRLTREEIRKFREKNEAQGREHIRETKKGSEVLVRAESADGGLTTVAA